MQRLLPLSLCVAHRTTMLPSTAGGGFATRRPTDHRFLSSFFLSYDNVLLLLHRQQKRKKDLQASIFSKKKKKDSGPIFQASIFSRREDRIQLVFLQFSSIEVFAAMSRAMGRNREDIEAGCSELLPWRRPLACFVGSMVAVMFVVLNTHLLSDLPIWLILGIVGVAAFILTYGNFQQRPREAEAESQAYMEERLRRTRSNLPALRVRLALMDRDFDELDYEDLKVLDEDITPDAPSTSQGDTKARYMVQSHVHTRRTQDNELACIVCLEQFNAGELIRSLPCLHQFHVDCADPWLRQEGTCPICKYRVGPGFHESDNDEPEHMV